jgi:hypothetical protein
MDTFLNKERFIEISYDSNVERRAIRVIWHKNTQELTLEANSDGMAYLATNFTDFLCGPHPNENGFRISHENGLISASPTITFFLDESLDTE